MAKGTQQTAKAKKQIATSVQQIAKSKNAQKQTAKYVPLRHSNVTQYKNSD